MHQVTSIPCDLLADNKVKDCIGRDLGRVEEVLINPRNGSISHAIVAFGGFLGASDRLFVVPWEAMDLNPRTRTFQLRVDRETLRTAPKFMRDEPRPITDDYLSGLDAHYAQPAACTAA